MVTIKEGTFPLVRVNSQSFILEGLYRNDLADFIPDLNILLF